MQYWPTVTIKNETFNFNFSNADRFSFYQFILTKNNTRYSASVCSAPFVGLNLSKSKLDIENDLSSWFERKKTNPKEAYPSEKLNMPLVPGKVYSSYGNHEWNKLPEPFYNFLLDAAYQNIGTDDPNVLKVAFLRIPEIIHIKVSGAREFDDKQDDDFLNQKPDGKGPEEDSA